MASELPGTFVGEVLPMSTPKPKPNLGTILTENLHPAILNHIPARYKSQTPAPGPGGRLRSRSKPKAFSPAGSGITALKTSFSLWDGVRELQRHQWKESDIQHFVIAGLILFSLYIAPSAPALKFFALVGGSWLLLMPATGQFFRPSIPIWTWLIYFFCSRFIPNEYRPHIWVRVLPALENVLYGANLSNILSAHQHTILDLLAWLPYGIIHFGAPPVCALIMFIFGAPGTTPVFARCFGWMCILGVTIQLCFPCTPPWYENERGLVPAAYGMPGSPAGLARLDAIFGVDLYTTNFSTAPVPFGAFPSLHAANAVLEALFMSHCFPQLRTYFIIYAGWVWWATMYLSHHYAIDLVGGGLIAATFYYTARARWLPRRQEGKMLRWEYEFVEIGETNETLDEERDDHYFNAGLLSHRRASSSSGVTLASGSSSWDSSSGTMSPKTPDLLSPGGPIETQGHLWDSVVPQREVELQDVVIVR